VTLAAHEGTRGKEVTGGRDSEGHEAVGRPGWGGEARGRLRRPREVPLQGCTLKWLIATIALGVFGVGSVWGLVMAYPLAKDVTNGTIAQFVMTRAIAFAFASFLTAWAARNYRAHRHLHVINEHRSKALETFKAFVSAAHDEQTQSTVLLEATRCIVTAGSSGYAGEEPAGPAERIIEIVKTITDRK
jgi:hypothetical protein